MADDPYDSDSAVEQILSEAMDLHALEQLSSINLSGVSSHSLLPSDLETRFRKLKSFPQTNPKRHNPPQGLISQIDDIPTTPKSSNSIPTTPKPSNSIPTTPISPSPIWDESDFKPNSKTSYASSSSPSPSPPRSRQSLCFLCSPKSKTKRVPGKKKKKKSKERNAIDDDLDLFVSDLSKFSLKEHKRSLKRALKEQERISREAEQVVDMAKQLSARIEDFEIDDDRFKFK